MSSNPLEAVDIARDYYNSEDADHFYSTVWGGEDIHIGIYLSDDEPVFNASLRTQERMITYAKKLSKDSRVIDLGSGYGGSARYLANRFGCRVVAFNLSEVENERARELNREQELDELIEVVDGNFEELPYKNEQFDLVWSQDAFLHSPDREQVLKEASRVLKPGGDFIFTDPMQSDDCPEGVLQPILDRIHLESMASPRFYKSLGTQHSLKFIRFEELTEHLKKHYAAILRETQKNEKELQVNVSNEYLENMKTGLQHWINGAQKEFLSWGIFHFQKPSGK
ncbi:MAG: methyltransferase domain-containing protein [Balneolaceae bacterium]|nr:methyltransferase domain-containing protein [Balneolaceae bacterium]